VFREKRLWAERAYAMMLAVSALKGYSIAATDGRIGTVSYVLFDDRTWRVRWLVVDAGTDAQIDADHFLDEGDQQNEARALHREPQDPKAAWLSPARATDCLPATNMLAQTTLRAVLGQHELDEMLSERKKLSTDIQSILDTAPRQGRQAGCHQRPRPRTRLPRGLASRGQRLST
jgi:sporulation protein YlmC with PRC-barrel domain